MTLVEATRTLRKLANGRYCAIKVECTIVHSGQARIEYTWYAASISGSGGYWSEQFPSFEALLQDAYTRLCERIGDVSGEDCKIGG